MQILVLLLVLFVAGFVMLTMLALTFLLMLAGTCAIGLPVYFVARHWAHKNGFVRSSQRPLDRLKALYVEGKIDMFEFERRAAALLSLEP
ncbi:MAG: hypothetical protein ACR2JC_08890 [Chloroflexota bacterium]